MSIEVDYLMTSDFTAAFKNTASKRKSFQHYHSTYELCFFINANMDVFIKDTRYRVGDGDILFINEYAIHRFIDNNPSLYNRYVVTFSKNFILPVLKALGIESVLDYFKNNDYTRSSTTLKEKAELESLFKSLVQAGINSNGLYPANFHTVASKSYLALILFRIMEIMSSYQPRGRDKNERLVQEIVKFIDTNYMSEISLEMLEKQFFIDKFRISHIFKDITDFSVMEYVQQRRILEAQILLKSPDGKLVDICLNCGFNNTQHFHRVFKKITGITPEKYRKVWANNKDC